MTTKVKMLPCAWIEDCGGKVVMTIKQEDFRVVVTYNRCTKCQRLTVLDADYKPSKYIENETSNN